MTEPKTTALARVEPARTGLAHPSDFGPEHMRIVRNAFAAGASQEEFEVLWAGAKARGLDPVKKQIYFVKRKDYARGGVEVWSSQVSIDGFRSIAVSSRHYDGQDEPEYEYAPDGALVLARVRVWRKGVSRPFVGAARWNEYVQTKQGGDPTHMWAKMEHTMLGKCAEALGLRKAFPEELGGLYASEEMDQTENTAPPAQWRQEPKAALPPPVVTAQDLVERIKRATDTDTLLAILRQARTWPKVRANAWLRMLTLCDTADRVAEVEVLFSADELPPEIVAKLEEAARVRFVPAAEETAA